MLALWLARSAIDRRKYDFDAEDAKQSAFNVQMNFAPIACELSITLKHLRKRPPATRANGRGRVEVLHWDTRLWRIRVKTQQSNQLIAPTFRQERAKPSSGSPHCSLVTWDWNSVRSA